MTAALVGALLALNPAPTQAVKNPDPFRGSQESVARPQRSTSGGMTLEALHGLPLTRPVYSPPQSQMWLYQPYIGTYPGKSPGLGGYLPPNVGGNYHLGTYWWGW